MARYKLTIEYDGTNFSGWQIQPNAITVEQKLEEAFSTVLQQKIDLVGQGRTDSGVHAMGQVAHVDLPDEADVQKVIYGVNNLTGTEIQVVEAENVPPDFHARFDAVAREYEYTVLTRPQPLMNRYSWALQQPVNSELLHQCARLILGTHDFAGFSKYNEDNRTTFCEILYSRFEIEGEMIRYQIGANRFLRNMVRRLIGTMVRTAQGKMTMDKFEELLSNPATKTPSFTAPARGLVLRNVFYKKV